MSPLPSGPKAGSYRPPALGLLRLSNRTGLTTGLTETRLMSLVWRYEKESEVTSDETGWAMSIVGGGGRG